MSRNRLPTPAHPLRPGWGLRLLQIQMCVMLLRRGAVEARAARRGSTARRIYYVARLDDYFGRLPIPTWLFDTPWAVALMTWSVLAVELLAPVLLWFRETRRLALVAVVLFHLANEWTMHLFLFHWVMLCRLAGVRQRRTTLPGSAACFAERPCA